MVECEGRRKGEGEEGGRKRDIKKNERMLRSKQAVTDVEPRCGSCFTDCEYVSLSYVGARRSPPKPSPSSSPSWLCDPLPALSLNTLLCPFRKPFPVPKPPCSLPSCIPPSFPFSCLPSLLLRQPPALDLQHAPPLQDQPLCHGIAGRACVAQQGLDVYAGIIDVPGESLTVESVVGKGGEDAKGAGTVV